MDVNAALANTVEAVKKAPLNSKTETDIALNLNLPKNTQKNITQYHRKYKPPAKPATSKSIYKEPKSKLQTQNQNMTTQTPKSRNTNYNRHKKYSQKNTLPSQQTQYNHQ